MFGNFKHTMECKACKGKEQFETFPNKTHCKCGGELEYIGFQPYIDPILQGMLKEAKTIEVKIDTETIQLEETKTEEIIESLEIKSSIIENKVEESENIEEINIEEINIEENEEVESESIEEIKEIKDSSENKLTIDDIFDPNEKMTNAKMEPLMKEFIPKGEVEKLKLLKEHYSSTFEKAIKYIGKKNQTRLEELMAD